MKKAVVAFITNEQGLILAVSRKDNPNDFGLPGGKVDPGETLEEAVIREIKEETGLNFFDIQPIFVRVCHGKVDYETTTFIGKYDGKIHTEELGNVQWVKPRVLVEGPFKEYNLALFDFFYKERFWDKK